MISIDELTIDQVHEDYKTAKYTSRQLVEAYLERIHELDQQGPKLNAITIVSPLALIEADTLDTHFKNHKTFIGSLHGVPVIVKDQCDTKGIETAYGNICCKHVPSDDATLVKKLKDAGAIILAKSTMPDFAASFNSTSSVSGVTLNPYDITRETGGSSAGTGAAIGANYGLIGVGEDTGGSIRVPSSFCNLVGLRPTVGLISRSGLSPLVSTQDTPGPMTRTVRDAALMLDVLVGYDAKDPFTANLGNTRKLEGGSYAANLSIDTLTSARLGVLKSVFGQDSDADCASVNKVVRDFLSRLNSRTTLVDTDVSNLQQLVDFSATYLSRSRYDIDRFLTAHPVLRDVNVKSIYDTNQFHQALPLFERLGRGITHPYEDPQYAARLEKQQELQRLVMGVMIEDKLDAIIYPTTQIPAPTVKDVLGTRFRDHFPTNTSIGSQLKFPAISVPVGFTDDGLPVGLEILGIPFSEQKLLQLAFGVEALMKARRSPKF